MQNVTLEAEVVSLLKKQNKKMATAESCTGGLLSSAITNVSGASDVFEMGICTYSNNVKMQLINVKKQTLDEFGAVSAQTAAQMAMGIKNLANADFGVGITGVAGPTGGTAQKPVGLVYISVSCNDGTFVQKILVENSTRNQVRAKSVETALLLVIALLKNKNLPSDIVRGENL